MKILASCLLLALMARVQAQSIDTRAFTAGGASLSFNGGTHEVAVGEFGIQTLSSGNIVLTQGLLQPHVRSGVGILNALPGDVLRVYPNPATDFLRIEMSSDQSYEGLVYDPRGRIVAAFSVQNHTDFDVSHLSTGAYLLVLTDEKRSSRFSMRFVKQ